jgi:hypothetical protein
MASGVDGVFTKPFRDDKLKALLGLLEREGTKSTPGIRCALGVITGLHKK